MAALRIPRYAHIHKLAIVDDESSDAQIPEWEVEAAGFEPLLINRRGSFSPNTSPKRLVCLYIFRLYLSCHGSIKRNDTYLLCPRC